MGKNKMRRQRLEAAIHDVFMHVTEHAATMEGLEVIEYMLRELKDYDVLPAETLLSMVSEYQEALSWADEDELTCDCKYEYHSEEKV